MAILKLRLSPCIRRYFMLLVSIRFTSGRITQCDGGSPFGVLCRAQLTLPRELFLKCEHLLVRCEVLLAMALVSRRHALNNFVDLEVTLRSELLLAP